MLERLFKLFIILIIIGIVFYFAFNIIMGALVHNKKEVVLPNVVGKSIYNAVEELSNAGFGLKKDGEELNQNVPAGVILRQNPSAGMSVREGKLVRVTISQGGEMIYVPNLVGQTVRSADISLRYSTLVMGEVSKKYSLKMGKGTVLSQDIAAGSSVDKDSVVNIIVSDGPPPEGVVLMPDFVNKNLEEAGIWAAHCGIALNIAGEKFSGIRTNIVLRQLPEADTDVTDLESVSLWLSA
ncbi:conserved PASTA domain protein [Candidatus Endomicrobiellum trichonymphae]|nr:conserved PASTA domain protein [Candidatus Endomicrobium trichonymphae]